jgi:hypothetical protein
MLSWVVRFSLQVALDLSGLRRSQTCPSHIYIPSCQPCISRRPSHFSSTAYKMLLPKLLCFDNDPFSWGCTPPLSVLHSHSLRTSARIAHFCALTPFFVILAHFMGGGGYAFLKPAESAGANARQARGRWRKRARQQIRNETRAESAGR